MATIGEKEIKTKWPVVSGIELIDKHEGRQKNLVARKNYIPELEERGL